jgi:hypothetical protein
MDEVHVKWSGSAAGPWQAYFTWRPRCINGRWYWLTGVYRRERNIVVYPHQGWEFGDGFDVLRDA